MVKKRLIPSLLVRNGRIIQSIQFRHTNVIGNVITAVDFFNSWAVDEILILDVSRDNTGREEFVAIIDELSERCFVPLTVGGWITNINEISKLLDHGADKVVINTHAFYHPDFITEAAKVYGSQCIVVSIDARKNDDGAYSVYTDRGRINTKKPVSEWALEAENYGAGEIFITSIDNDGMRQGYDIELIKLIAGTVSIPVIAFGGVGDWQHFVDGINLGGADAVSAGNIFHFTEHSTKKAKEFLHEKGVPVRDTIFFKVSIPRKPRYKQY